MTKFTEPENFSEEVKSENPKIQSELASEKSSEDGNKRKIDPLIRLFYKYSKTKFDLDYYISIFPIF